MLVTMIESVSRENYVKYFSYGKAVKTHSHLKLKVM